MAQKKKKRVIKKSKVDAKKERCHVTFVRLLAATTAFVAGPSSTGLAQAAELLFRVIFGYQTLFGETGPTSRGVAGGDSGMHAKALTASLHYPCFWQLFLFRSGAARVHILARRGVQPESTGGARAVR